MAKAKKEKKKNRPKNYDPKLAIKGSFEDVIKLSTTYKPPAKKTPAKKKAAKKGKN